MLPFLLIIEDDVERDVLERVYRTHHKMLYLTAYTILKDYHEAEDVVQNVILRLSKNIEKISDVNCKKTVSYLVIITRNLCYDICRKNKKLQFIEEEGAREQGETLVEEVMIEMENAREMAEKLNRLHPPYADVLTLRYYHDLSIPEIAKCLDLTENNISVRLGRACEALKKLIEGEISDEKIEK